MNRRTVLPWDHLWHQHLNTDKRSHVFKHLAENQNCKASAEEGCFSILDRAPTKYQLKVMEGLYIKMEQPDLNKQQPHIAATLL